MKKKQDKKQPAPAPKTQDPKMAVLKIMGASLRVSSARPLTNDGPARLDLSTVRLYLNANLGIGVWNGIGRRADGRKQPLSGGQPLRLAGDEKTFSIARIMQLHGDGDIITHDELLPYMA